MDEYNLDSIVGLESAFNVMDNNPEELEKLYEDNFSLADLDISARVLKHWSTNGLLPDKERKGRNHRFNFFELIYIYMVQDLRKFGFPLNSIRKFKAQIFETIDPAYLLSQLPDGIIEMAREAQLEKPHVLDQLESVLKTIPDQSGGDTDKENQLVLLQILIFYAITQKQEVNLVILSNGNLYVESPGPHRQLNDQGYDYESRLVLPVFKYLKKFVSTDKYFEMLNSYRLINEREKYLLGQIREGKYKSILIKFTDDKMEMLEMKKETKVHNAARIDEILLKGSYQNIEMSTQDGTITYSAITTKKKF